MADDRLSRLYQAVAMHNGQPYPFARIKAMCHAAITLFPVDGAGVMLMADRTHQGTLYATDATIQRLEDLQNAAAEGPCIDSYRLGRPVLEPDLSQCHTWPHLTGAVLEAGIAALFSFPLQLDDASVGALNLYRAHPGTLTEEEAADARLLAAMAAREVVAMQAEAEPGTLPAQIGDLSGDRAAIEQATGMVSAQLEVSIDRAAQHLRAYATTQGRPLAAVALDVVRRTIRFP